MAVAQVSATNNPYNLPAELFGLWNSLTLEEKVGQMIMVYMTTPKFVTENHFGGVLVMNPHLSNVRQFGRTLTSITTKRELDPEAIERIAGEIGNTLKEIRINLNLAPAIDPPSDINGKETFMEHWGRSWDGIGNADKVRAFVKGMKANGITSASKHFPGYDSETNSDLQMAESEATEETIRNNVEFFKALATDVPIIMMSSVRYRKISNAPAVFEPKIVKMAHDIDDDIVVLTDDLWGTNLRSWISGTDTLEDPYPASEFRKVVMAALDAGNDMFMTTYPVKAVDMKNTLVELARQNKDYLIRIEKSVARILKMKFRAGIIRN